MSNDPAFLFYSSDFLTECSDLTMEERGQLITVYCLQHQKGRLSEKIIKLTIGTISEDVKNKLTIDEHGLYYSPKIEELIEQRRKYAESRRKNGSLGGRPKKPYAKPCALPYEKPTENLPENVNENININVNENNKLNKYGEFKNVCLEEGYYEKLVSLFGETKTKNAIEKLDAWLDKPKQKNKRNCNHRGYFKSNSWVWEEGKKETNYFYGVESGTYGRDIPL